MAEVFTQFRVKLGIGERQEAGGQHTKCMIPKG